MNWYVTIDYKRGSSFGVALDVGSEQVATEQAKEFAIACGFTETVKRVKVSIISAEVTA